MAVGTRDALIKTAEMSALPLSLQQLTRRFFDLQLDWLTSTLAQGIKLNEIPEGGGARHKAFLLLSILEGASFINWATNAGDQLSPSVIRLVVEHA